MEVLRLQRKGHGQVQCAWCNGFLGFWGHRYPLLGWKEVWVNIALCFEPQMPQQ